MKQINIQKSEVFLSTYDNSDLLLPVREEHKSLENVCVAVKFGDTLIKISPKETCECTWDEAMEKYKDEPMNTAFWQMVGIVYLDVNQAIEMLGHDPLHSVWTATDDSDPWYSSNHAWYYYAPFGAMRANFKTNIYSVRTTKVFKINE